MYKGGKMSRTIKTTSGIHKYKWEWNEFKYLIYVLSKANDFGEILNIFIDVHTTKEITEIIRRVIIASYIIDGKSYDEIVELTGASSATVSKISGKMLRFKQQLTKKITQAGSYSTFLTNQTDERDWLTKMIDRSFYKRYLGLFGRK